MAAAIDMYAELSPKLSTTIGYELIDQINATKIAIAVKASVIVSCNEGSERQGDAT